MFSVTNLMDTFGNRQRCGNTCPFVVDFGSHAGCRNEFRPFGDLHHHCHGQAPDLEQISRLCSPVANVLRQVIGERLGKNSTEQKESTGKKSENESSPCRKRKNDTSSCKITKDSGKMQKEMPAQPTMLDMLDEVMSTLHEINEGKETRKWWQEELDCRGFESKHIKVKIDSCQLLLKAFKKQKSENGVCTMVMRKSVPLPENIDSKKIRCRLASNGFLLIEAPYQNQKKEENAYEFDDIISSMLPGLEQLLRPRSGNETQEKENSTKDKSDECGDIPEPELEKGKGETSNAKTDEATQVGNNQACKKNIILPGEKCTTIGVTGEENQKEDTVNVQEKPEASNDPIITLAGDDANGKEDDVHGDGEGSVSNTSEDSFVLLSQLEKETNDDHDDGIESSAKKTSSMKYKDEDEMVMNEDGEEEDNDVLQKPDTSRTAENVMDEDEMIRSSDGGDNLTSGTTRSVSIDKDNDRVLFRLEMPSYNPASMKATFDNGKRLLVISASKETRSATGTQTDVTTKSVAIEEDVDVNALQCHFRDGTLTVTAPRKMDILDIPIMA